jgi:ABC-type cobalamin transport system permease subunit
MLVVIRCCHGAGMNEMWAIEIDAQDVGLPMRRRRWLFLASVDAVDHSFLEKKVMFLNLMQLTVVHVFSCALYGVLG